MRNKLAQLVLTYSIQKQGNRKLSINFVLAFMSICMQWIRKEFADNVNGNSTSCCTHYYIIVVILQSPLFMLALQIQSYNVYINLVSLSSLVSDKNFVHAMRWPQTKYNFQSICAHIDWRQAIMLSRKNVSITGWGLRQRNNWLAEQGNQIWITAVDLSRQSF